jgi:hypothetical protein
VLIFGDKGFKFIIVQLQKEDASNKEVVESRETNISTVETHVDVALETKPETRIII